MYSYTSPLSCRLVCLGGRLVQHVGCASSPALAKLLLETKQVGMQQSARVTASPKSPFRYDDETNAEPHSPYYIPCPDCPPLKEELARLTALLAAETLARKKAEQVAQTCDCT